MYDLLSLKPSTFEPHISAFVVNSPDADVTFQSSDNILFKVSRKDLETFSHGFSASFASTDPTVAIPLTEPADVLELLFQFTSPLPQEYPDIHDIKPFKVIHGLAEAAEKYQVPAAAAMCKFEMRYQ